MAKRYIDIAVNRFGEVFQLQDRRFLDGQNEGDVVVDGNISVTNQNHIYIGSDSAGVGGDRVATEPYVDGKIDESSTNILQQLNELRLQITGISESVNQAISDLTERVEALEQGDIVYYYEKHPSEES